MTLNGMSRFIAANCMSPDGLLPNFLLAKELEYAYYAARAALKLISTTRWRQTGFEPIHAAPSWTSRGWGSTQHDRNSQAVAQSTRAADEV